MNRLVSPSPQPAMGWRLAITFAVVALLFMAPTPQSMALNILDLATSLVDHGSVGLDEFSQGDVAVRDGRILSGMPPGASLVAALVYLLARPLLWLVPAGSALTALYVSCTVLVGIPAAAVTVHLTYRTAIRWGVSERAALLTAGLLAFGTMHFGYATGFYKKTLASLCLMAAFVLLMPERGDSPSPSRSCLAGILCGLAIGQDYPTVVIAVALGGYLLMRRPAAGAIVTFAAGTGIALLPILLYHWAAFGSPWATAYQFRMDPAGNTMTGPRPGPFLFLLFTLLAASPCLLWSVRGWWRAFQMRERRTEMVTIAGIVLGTLVLISGWASYYPHEASFSSRLILPMIPFAVLPMAFGMPARLSGCSLILIAWSVGAALLAAQASMIPTSTIPPWYALKVLGTSWGAGALFSESLAAGLGAPTLHSIISKKTAVAALLEPESRGLLLDALLGQALVKVMSVAATTIAGLLLWHLVWRPVVKRAGAPQPSRPSGGRPVGPR